MSDDNKFGVIVADPPWSFNDKLKYPKDGVKRRLSVASGSLLDK